MVEHSIQDCDAVAEVRLEQRHEWTAIPGCKGCHAESASVIVPDAFPIEAGPVFIVVEVVGLGQFCEEAAPVRCERPAGKQLFDCRTNP